MRILLVLLFLIASPIHAQFPSSHGPEIPVSDPNPGPAAETQYLTAVASNGSMVLVGWNDARRGVSGSYIARLTAQGEPLDPLGIALGKDSLEALLWNGAEFVAVVFSNSGRDLLFITQHGEVRERRHLGGLGQYARFAAKIDGAGGRILLVERYNSSGDMRTRFEIFDGFGFPVALPVILPSFELGYNERAFVAGTNGDEFLLLRDAIDFSTTPPRVLSTAHRISANGQLLSTARTGLRVELDESFELAGRGSEYVLLQQPMGKAEFRFHFLDARGTFTGKEGATIGAPYEYARARLFAEADRYLVTWSGQISAVKGLSFVTELRPDGSLSQNYLVGNNIPIPGTSRLVHTGAGLLAIFSSVDPMSVTSANRTGDLFSSLVSKSLESADAQLIAFSSTIQSETKLVASRYGVLAAWTESGRPADTNTYLRRFSPSGSPIGPPIPLERAPISWTDVALTSNGEVYLVAWRGSSGIQIRRMDARSGEWIDDEPHIVAIWGTPNVASNGSDAIVITEESCGPRSCLRARHVPMSGALLLSDPIEVATDGWFTLPAVASNGSDYLLVWSAGFRTCAILCSIDPFTLQAIRLRADATRIDAAPLTLLDRQTGSYPDFPVVAWDGQRYTIAWTDGPVVRGARMTAEGSLNELGPDSRGTALDILVNASPRPSLVSHEQSIVLLTRTIFQPTNDGRWPVRLTALAFDRNTPLAEVATIPRTIILDGDHRWQSFAPSAASWGPLLLIAYEREAFGLNGGVPRAFLRRYGDLPARRRMVAR